MTAPDLASLRPGDRVTVEHEGEAVPGRVVRVEPWVSVAYVLLDDGRYTWGRPATVDRLRD